MSKSKSSKADRLKKAFADISYDTVMALLAGGKDPRAISALALLKKNGWNFANFPRKLVIRMMIDQNLVSLRSLKKMGYDMSSIEMTFIDSLLNSDADIDTITTVWKFLCSCKHHGNGNQILVSTIVSLLDNNKVDTLDFLLSIGLTHDKIDEVPSYVAEYLIDRKKWQSLMFLFNENYSKLNIFIWKKFHERFAYSPFFGGCYGKGGFLSGIIFEFENQKYLIISLVIKISNSYEDEDAISTYLIHIQRTIFLCYVNASTPVMGNQR